MRRRLITAAIPAALVGMLLPFGPAVAVLALWAVVATVALAAVRVRLREIKAHDRRATRWAEVHGGTDWHTYDGDEAERP